MYLTKITDLGKIDNALNIISNWMKMVFFS